MIVFSGRSNPVLAQKISSALGEPLGLCEFKTFKDGEIWVKFKENIRGRDVFIVQSTQAPAENILEILIMLDAAKRASAKRVTAVIPYYGYARQDRKDQPRVSISSKLFADLLTAAGASRIMTMDLHAPQIQGFFNIPVDHLYSSGEILQLYKDRHIPNLAVAAPDVGRISMARSFARRLGADLIVIDKERVEQNVSEVINVIGQVEGKNVLIVDDMIDTGGTFSNAVRALKKKGALDIYGACTHALLSGDCLTKLEDSGLKKLTVTDTIPTRPDIMNSDLIEIRSVAGLFAEAIRRTHRNESITGLFDTTKD